jgi:hypothetical protein
VELLDQMFKFKEKLNKRTSVESTSENFLSSSSNAVLAEPFSLKRLLSLVFSFTGVSDVIHETILPFFNSNFLLFPNRNEFVVNDNTSLPLPSNSSTPVTSPSFVNYQGSVNYLHSFLTPIVCQLITNVIQSISSLYHYALNEDESAITLSTLPLFFLILLQLDITLENYLEFCQPQFMLSSQANELLRKRTSLPSASFQHYKRRSYQQLPSYLVSLFFHNRQSIHLLLTDYSDLLAINSSISSVRRNVFSNEIVERIRYHQNEINKVVDSK